MGKQVVLEVTQPFHANGREVLYQPGHQFPLGADLPAGLVVREVIADVPDAPAKAAPEGKPAANAGGEGHLMSGDAGTASDQVSVSCACGHAERGFGTTRWQVQRWDADQTRWVQRRSGLAAPDGADFLRARVQPYSVTETVGNLITNSGYSRIGNLFSNQGATQALDGTHCRIGAGDGVTAVAYADTDLSAVAGSTHRWFQLVSANWTIGGTRTWVVAATFGTADGNFAWNEFGIDQGTASGNTVTAILLNHALSSQGTKASGQTWTATATITWT